ncbi:MAG: hypothetical protein ACJ8GW_00045 [Massilia sp.]
MKSTSIKIAAALALLTTSAVAFAASNGCCGSLECCLNMLSCCF